MKALDLKDKVSVVVGGTGDIGSKIVETLAEAGSITILTDINKKKGDILARDLMKRFKVTSAFYKCDISYKKT